MSLLFVPGTGGTKLMKNGNSLGHPKVLDGKLWLLNATGGDTSKIVQDMSMKHEAGRLEPVSTTLTPGAQVEAGEALTVAYNQILPKADDVFLYDWRGCIEYSGLRLLADLKKRATSGKVKLVGHSQGGLVIIAASKLIAKRYKVPFSDWVSHVALVGTPTAGTLNAAHALITGEDLGESASEEFRKIAATWPALYQMLPDWRALREPDGTDSRYSFFHAATYANYPWVDPFLLERAWKVRRHLLRGCAEGFGGVSYQIWFTRNRKTWDHATRAADKSIVFGAKDQEGDSLVPYHRTLARMADVPKNRHHAVGPGENTPEHSMLLNDDWLVTQIMSGLS